MSDLSDLYTERQQWRDILAAYPATYPQEWEDEERTLRRAIASEMSARLESGQPSLLARIRSVTCGEMIAPTSDTGEEWRLVPASYKRKGGIRADELAQDLGFPSEDALRSACILDAERRKMTSRRHFEVSLEEAEEAPEYRELCARHEAEWQRMQEERAQIEPHLYEAERRIYALEHPPVTAPEPVVAAYVPPVYSPVTPAPVAPATHPGRAFRRWLGLALTLFWLMAPKQNNGYWWYGPVVAVTFVVVYLEARYWIRRRYYGVR